MTPERYEQVKTIVADALEIERTERAAFVTKACGADEELRGEVDSMLAHSTDRLDRAAERLSASRDADGSLPGQRLGAYEVVREIGRGGMGAVYLARRADKAFEKEVAIKLLKRGTDSDEVLRRFRAERQILARLEHPNIARLIDAGTSDDGLPYFVMEYVDGEPITDFCVARKLNTRARIELMLQVCSAVQFAHQNLVVHRDLKPRNILVTPEGVPKLLDFGIAKLLAEESDAVQMTIEGAQRLTPGYASPEQVRGEAVTTASDVYSLGALLYELASGYSPHRFETTHPSPTELFRVIVEREAPRLETTETDLNTIIGKALEKEPQRRYSGASALADDLQRYLAGRPVHARPATLSYRASRFVRRNKLGVAAGVALFVTLLGGVAATLWQAREAQRQAALAQRRFNDVRKLARAVVFDYHDLVAPLRGATPVKERLVRDAIEYLDALFHESGADPGLLREIAIAYAKVGRVQGNSYFSNLGDTAGALKSYRKALELQERLLANDPANRELINETASTQTGLGDVLYTIEDLPAALHSYERAIALREPVVAAAPEDRVSRLELAETYSRVADLKGFEHYSNLGDPAGGLVAARRARDLLEPAYAKDPQNRDMISRLANVLVHLGALAAATGDVASAMDAQQKAVTMLESLAAREPDNQSTASELLAARHFLRFTLEDAGQLEDALALSHRIVAEVQRLLAADEKNQLFRRNLALSYSALGRELLLAGDAPGALAQHEQAIKLLDELLAAAPDSIDRKKDLALALWRLGQAQTMRSQHAAAIETLRKALSLRESGLTADPASISGRDDVASIKVDVARALAAMKDFAAAEEALRQALPMAEEISTKAPTSARLRAHLATAYADAGRVSREAGDREEARARLTKSLQIWQELREKGTLIPANAAQPDEIARELAAL